MVRGGKMVRLIIFFVISLIVGSCINNKKSNYLIPEDTFKHMLLDIHLIDGYYMMNYSKYVNHTDSSNFYNQLFKSYGYTNAQFDSTVKYYTLHLKKFDNIYEDVITNLTRMNQETTSIQYLYSDSAHNLYKGKKSHFIQMDSTTNTLPFDIAFKDTGNYEISVQIKVYPDDQSVHLRISAFFWYDDKTKDGKRMNFDVCRYTKDKYAHVYKISKHIRNKKFTHLKGHILDQDFQSHRFKKHVDIRAIIVRKV